MIGNNQHTLDPVGREARRLPRFTADPGRVVVTYAGQRPELGEDWARVTLADGRAAEVRRADCGAGCRCAGEVRLAKVDGAALARVVAEVARIAADRLAAGGDPAAVLADTLGNLRAALK
mgnify:CR=1 FL=1